MNQQYVLLTNENDLLKSLIGQSFNQKSKFEAERILDEIHSKAESRLIGKKALCYVVDKDEIKGVGGSTLLKDKNGKIVSNLILDNFGLLLAGLFFGNPAASLVLGLVPDTGIGINVNLRTSSNFQATQGSGGSVHKIGSGTTAPARTDFGIETAFGTSPEDSDINSTDPVFDSASGRFKSASLITAGGSGTINEAVLKSTWNDQGGLKKKYSQFRDAISPGQDFIAGQTIALEYLIQL